MHQTSFDTQSRCYLTLQIEWLKLLLETFIIKGIHTSHLLSFLIDSSTKNAACYKIKN